MLYPLPLATLLLTALGLALLLTVQRPDYLRAWGSGVLLGLLALTRASYSYAIPLLALLFFVSIWRQPGGRRQLAIGLGGFCLAAALVVFPWMWRNQHHFDRFFITERGGYQLNVRAQYLMF